MDDAGQNSHHRGLHASGTTDILALIGQKFTEAWEAPVVVDNRPANGNIGTEIAAKSAPTVMSFMGAAGPASIGLYPCPMTRSSFGDRSHRGRAEHRRRQQFVAGGALTIAARKCRQAGVRFARYRQHRTFILGTFQSSHRNRYGARRL
jgi:hypothetical protein